LVMVLLVNLFVCQLRQAGLPPPSFSAVPPITADMATLAPTLIFGLLIAVIPSEDTPIQTNLKTILPALQQLGKTLRCFLQYTVNES
jgi:cell division inhibitor SulA